MLKLTQLIEVWEVLHVKDTGDVGFCDLMRALEHSGITVIDDTPKGLPPRRTGEPPAINTVV